MEKSKHIKLIAIDLDGTLYDENKHISDRSKNSILKALKAGVQPMIATGRGPDGAEQALDLLGFDLPYICSAGAMIKNGKNGDTLYAKTFENIDDLTKMIAFARVNDCALIAEPLEGGLIYFGSDESFKIMDTQTIREIQRGKRSVDPEMDFARPLLKFTLVADRPMMEAFRAMVESDCQPYNMVVSGTQFMDLTAKNANKGSALEYYAKYIGIDAIDIAAIGDQQIDVHMLSVAGVKFAVENAVDELKAIANVIAPSNNDHGVEWAIEYILENHHASKQQ